MKKTKRSKECFECGKPILRPKLLPGEAERHAKCRNRRNF